MNSNTTQPDAVEVLRAGPMTTIQDWPGRVAVSYTHLTLPTM